jgi:acetylornithine/N-succinyldiaminopimelate aminotransferase
LENGKNLVDDNTCAVFMEAIQGEGGVIPLDEKYVKDAAEFLSERDILLIFDEVQTGIGRTGSFFGYQYFDIKPDIVTFAKGIGGGLPIGGFMCKKELSNVLSNGTHGSTFGGNPIACAAGIAVLNKILSNGFLKEVNKKSDYLRYKLSMIDEIVAIRGRGLMLGLELKSLDAKKVSQKCVENGLLILTAKTALRLLPPLTISTEEIDKGVEALKKTLMEMAN